MAFISCSQATLLQSLFLFLVICGIADASNVGLLETRNDNLAGTRRLAAAHKRIPIKSRNSEQALRHDHEFHYLEAETYNGNAAPFSASIRMSAKRPTLQLEILEHHIDQIECSDDKIFLGFATAEALNEVYRHVEGVKGFFLITSHQSCDIEGERNVRLVSNLTVDAYAHSMEISAFPILWKDSYRSMKVDFGATTEDLSLRRHEGLRKRQDSTASVTISPSAAFPVLPSSSPTPTIREVTENIELSYQDTQILPPVFPGVDSLTLNAPAVPDGVSFGCKNCTVQGNIALSQGTFTLRSADPEDNEFFNTTREIVHFFEDGFVKFDVLDFSAHIELESAVKRAQEIRKIQIPFPNITLTPWQIPGIASVGPVFSPNLVVGAQLETDLTFTYGFDLDVPKNSSIILDIADITNSSITGFSDTSITALPFQAAFNEISLTLFAAFQPQLLMGINVFNDAGTAGAGAYLHFPEISATVSQVANVNSKCEPTNDTSGEGAEGFFGSLTRLTSEVDLSVGVLAEARVEAGNFFELGAITTYELWNTSFPLPTACYSFDAAAQSFGSPTATATATGTAGGNGIDGGGGNSAATAGMSNPLGHLITHWGRLETTFAVIGCVFAVFLGL